MLVEDDNMIRTAEIIREYMSNQKRLSLEEWKEMYNIIEPLPDFIRDTYVWGDDLFVFLIALQDYYLEMNYMQKAVAINDVILMIKDEELPIPESVISGDEDDF